MRKYCLIGFILLAVSLFDPSTGIAQSTVEPESVQAPATQLARQADGIVSISTRANTGVASFVRVSPGGDLLPAARSQSAVGKSSDFFASYGALFGITNPAAELRLEERQTDDLGNILLTYQQLYQGVQVYGAQLKTHYSSGLALTAVNGVFVPAIHVDPIPVLGAGQAGEIALQVVAAQGDLSSAGYAIATNQLTVYRTGLVQGVAGDDHLVYAVEVTNHSIKLREFVFVDAHSGKIVDQIMGVADTLRREVSEASLANVIWVEGNLTPIPSGWAGGSAQQVIDWQNELDGAGETYNLISSMAGRDAYDGAGATMRTINNAPSIACPNARWDGISTNYCTGVTGDDIVAHEWAHAYTEYTGRLIYQWQSGALNESYSDIWGEIVDLLNGRGTDIPGGLRSTGGCSVFGTGAPGVDSSYRWLVGEDSPAFGGAIRDMWSPTCFGDPGKVSDAEYNCDNEGLDNGGVHDNSGVPNHAFALLVDGGTYNGQTVTALGLTKAAHIHWYAQTSFLTAASDFGDQADALQAACTALIGVNLSSMSTSNPARGAPSGQIISAADCEEVAKTVAAVEFHTNVAPRCGFTRLLQPNAPALCTNPEVVHTLFAETWESGTLPAGWSVGTRAVVDPAHFGVPNWAVVGALPAGALSGSTQAAFVQNPNPLSRCSDNIDHSGVLYLESPTFSIPAIKAKPRVAFDHWVATEARWDGGNLKLSVNGGQWTVIPAAAYTFNAYNASLTSAAERNSNPMAGEVAFTGTDGGSNGGSWGQSQIDLSGLVAPGDQVKLRFELGQDGCSGMIGWYVDTVRAFFCSIPADVGITKTVATGALASGGAITYTLSFSNAGPGLAVGVLVSDRVPVSVTVTGITSSTVGAGVAITQTGASPAFAWAVSDLAAGAGGFITLTGTLSDNPTIYGTPIVNVATVSASNDITVSNNSSAAGLALPFLLSTAGAGTGSGSVSLDPAGGTYPFGTVVTLTAVAETGSIFAGWSGAVLGTNSPVTLTMDGNKVVTATFSLEVSKPAGELYLPLVRR